MAAACLFFLQCTSKTIWHEGGGEELQPVILKDVSPLTTTSVGHPRFSSYYY